MKVFPVYINSSLDLCLQVDAPVREWDLHKLDQLEPDERERRHGNSQIGDKKEFEERRVRKRSHSPSPGNLTLSELYLWHATNDHALFYLVRKVKKKPDEGPAKLLDDLFRKTKSSPCIYWLPLSPEQVLNFSYLVIDI